MKSKIPAHWLISFPMVIIGALLYRALASGWITLENTALNWIVQVVAITCAVAGLCIFIFLGHIRRVREAHEHEREK